MRIIISILVSYFLIQICAAQVLYFDLQYNYNNLWDTHGHNALEQDSFYFFPGRNATPFAFPCDTPMILKVNKFDTSMAPVLFRKLNGAISEIIQSANHKQKYYIQGVESLCHFDDGTADGFWCYMYGDSVDYTSLKKFGSPQRIEAPYKTIISSAKALVTVGWSFEPTGRSAVMIYQCDTNLNQQFLKLYPSADPEVNHFGAGIVETPDHGFLIVGTHRLPSNTDKDVAFIFKTDAQGNQVWWKEFPPSGGVNNLYFNDIRKQLNGSYIAIGHKWYQQPGVSWYQSYWVVGINEQGEILWEKEHESHYAVVWNKIVPAPDGNYLVCGAEWDYPEPGGGGYPTYGVVGKLSPQGDLLWKRRYTSGLPFNTAVQFYAIIATSDGGILAGGHTQTGVPERQNFWMLKLDSTGCLTPGCDTTSAVIDINSNRDIDITVVPNPTTGFCVIQSREDSRMERVEVFSAFGRRVLEYADLAMNSVRLDLTGQPTGVYFCQIWVDGAAVVRQVVVAR